MSSRLLLTGTLASAAVRRKRRADNAVFAVAKVRDTDRGGTRIWTAFANDPDLIERLEALAVGEPIAMSGPFSITGARELEYRISCETLIDTKRKKKPKGQIAKEQRVASDELDQAPAGDPDDPLPF